MVPLLVSSGLTNVVAFSWYIGRGLADSGWLACMAGS